MWKVARGDPCFVLQFLLHGTIVGYITPYIITKKSLQLYSTQKMNFSVKNIFSKCRKILFFVHCQLYQKMFLENILTGGLEH